jgi:hypothetical protein
VIVKIKLYRSDNFFFNYFFFKKKTGKKMFGPVKKKVVGLG